MAFKMKAGKEGPMKKNFGSAMKKPLVGNQKNLPDHLKKKILDAPTKAMKNDAPMMRMKKGAMKKMGAPMKDDGVRQGFKDLASNVIGKDASKERQKQDSQKQAFLKNWKKLTPEQKAKVPNAVKKIYGV